MPKLVAQHQTHSSTRYIQVHANTCRETGGITICTGHMIHRPMADAVEDLGIFFMHLVDEKRKKREGKEGGGGEEREGRKRGGKRGFKRGPQSQLQSD